MQKEGAAAGLKSAKQSSAVRWSLTWFHIMQIKWPKCRGLNRLAAHTHPVNFDIPAHIQQRRPSISTYLSVPKLNAIGHLRVP